MAHMLDICPGETLAPPVARPACAGRSELLLAWSTRETVCSGQATLAEEYKGVRWEFPEMGGPILGSYCEEFKAFGSICRAPDCSELPCRVRGQGRSSSLLLYFSGHLLAGLFYHL